MIFGILFLVVGLLVSVGIHELGHLIPAKRFGVKVSQYFIGFGPTLWSRTRNGTEYGIKAIPLGGFVRIAGMLPPGSPDRRTHNAKGRLTMAEEARQDSAAELAPGEDHLAFWRLSAPKKLAVMFGGPATNAVLCVVFMTIALCGIGTPRVNHTVGAVSPCIAEQCSADSPASPAKIAGFLPGDTITSWNGAPVASWTDVTTAIANGGTEPVSVVVLRDGEDVTLSVTPVLAERKVVTGSGDTVTKQVPSVGIVAGRERVRYSFGQIVGATSQIAKGTAQALVRLPVSLWETTRSLVTGEKREANGVVGIVGVAEMAGSITSADSAAYDAASRLADLLMILASLNMTLFLFNLIPLLPLDGGHLAGATFEGLRRQVARLRGLSDPGPVDTARLAPLSYAVAVAFIGMTLLLVAADILNPVSWF